MIPLAVPSLKGNELQYVADCIATEWVSSAGAYVQRFEREIAAYVGAPHAVACVNGTAALHVACLLSGIGPEDEVIVPTVTFIAPVNAVRYVGAHPVFMDCDDRLNLDPEKVAEFLRTECDRTDAGVVNRTTGRRIRAIVVVHVFGHPCNLRPLTAVAATYELPIIEDATESLGSFYTDWDGERRATGTIGAFGCFSFNGNKLITTGGGGMLVTHDAPAAKRAAYLTTQAKDDPVRFVHHDIGYNYRLTNVQAAIGCAQLEQIEQFIRTKRENFLCYQRELADIPGLTLVPEPPYAHSNMWYYTLLVDAARFRMDAATLHRRLAAAGIETRPLWELNHRQQPYRDCQAWRIERAERLHRQALNLPCSVGLDTALIPKICQIIKEG